MSCQRCGSKRLFQFEATRDAVPRAQLPVSCRDCGLITVAGQPLAVPPELEQHAQQLAEAAAGAGARAKEDLLRDPDVRIAEYFKNVYTRAYLDGFIRAHLFQRHNAKEGRLVRMRTLFALRKPLAHLAESDRVAIELPKAAYDELASLLALGEHHVPRPQDQDPPEPTSDA